MDIIRIRGKLADLCVFRTDDAALEKYMKWMNDESILMHLGRNAKICDWQSEKEFINQVHGSMFNIIDKNHNLIGNCDIRKEKGNRNYSLGICIGEQDSRNKGIGTEVIRLLIKFCFEELGAHRVCLTLNGDNLRAKRCYEKAGMKECGREHETSWYKGQWSDTIHMEILETDYFHTNDIWSYSVH